MRGAIAHPIAPFSQVVRMGAGMVDVCFHSNRRIEALMARHLHDEQHDHTHPMAPSPHGLSKEEVEQSISVGDG